MTEEAALAHFGIRPAALLGEGGESRVFDLGDGRALRVFRDGSDPDLVEARAGLAAEIAEAAAGRPIGVPRILEAGRIDHTLWWVEARLAGRDLTAVLGSVAGRERARLLDAYFAASRFLSTLAVDRPWFGDLVDNRSPVRSETWAGYVVRKAHSRLALSGSALHAAGVDPEAVGTRLDADLPLLTSDEPARLVHADYFPGNVLVDRGSVTAVIDIGTVAIAGDPRIDVVSAGAYLALIEPTTGDDVDHVRNQVVAELGEETTAAFERWLAVFWSNAVDDRRLFGWCVEILTRD